MTLSYIRGQLPEDITRLIDVSPLEASSANSESSGQGERIERNREHQRFLGQASDVRFFHAIKEILQDEDLTETTQDGGLQSYDLEAPALKRSDNGSTMADLPTRELADSYVDKYFFTIHIAYPFVNKSDFMTRYRTFWDTVPAVKEDTSWLSLLCEFTTFVLVAVSLTRPFA